MKKRELLFRIDFSQQTPVLMLKYERNETLYEKAYLSREAETLNEYKYNTTTWD